MTFWGRSQTFVQTLDSQFSFVRKSLRRRHEAGRRDRSARLKTQAGGEQGEMWTNALPPFSLLSLFAIEFPSEYMMRLYVVKIRTAFIHIHRRGVIQNTENGVTHPSSPMP